MRQLKEDRNKLKYENSQLEVKINKMSSDFSRQSTYLELELQNLKESNKELQTSLSLKYSEQKSKHDNSIDGLKNQLSNLEVSSQKTIK